MYVSGRDFSLSVPPKLRRENITPPPPPPTPPSVRFIRYITLYYITPRTCDLPGIPPGVWSYLSPGETFPFLSRRNSEGKMLHPLLLPSPLRSISLVHYITLRTCDLPGIPPGVWSYLSPGDTFPFSSPPNSGRKMLHPLFLPSPLRSISLVHYTYVRSSRCRLRSKPRSEEDCPPTAGGPQRHHGIARTSCSRHPSANHAGFIHAPKDRYY